MLISPNPQMCKGCKYYLKDSEMFNFTCFWSPCYWSPHKNVNNGEVDFEKW